MADIKLKDVVITQEDLERTCMVLHDNGIDATECGVVLQAIGCTLLDTELDCESVLPYGYTPMKLFSDFIKEYFGKDVTVNELASKQYSEVVAAYGNKYGEDSANYGDE